MTDITARRVAFQLATEEYERIEQDQFRDQLVTFLQYLHQDIESHASLRTKSSGLAVKKYQFMAMASGER